MIKLEELKAAMALACHDDVQWVRVPVTVNGVKYIVAQVPVERGPEACAVFRAYGLSDERVINGSGCPALMPIELDKFEPLSEVRQPLVLDEGPDHETKNKFLRQLYEHGITRCEVTYSGSDDSSNPSEFQYYIAPLPFRAHHGTPAPVRALAWQDALEASPVGETFENEVHEWIYGVLSEDYDTYNNDGGGGSLTFDLSDPARPVVTFELYTNELVSTTHINTEL